MAKDPTERLVAGQATRQELIARRNLLWGALNTIEATDQLDPVFESLQSEHHYLGLELQDRAIAWVQAAMRNDTTCPDDESCHSWNKLWALEQKLLQRRKRHLVTSI